MKPISMLDMLKATRLTAAGQLTKATALLRGTLMAPGQRTVAVPVAPADAPSPEPVIDMVPPPHGEGPWTSPGDSPGDGASIGSLFRKEMPEGAQDLLGRLRGLGWPGELAKRTRDDVPAAMPPDARFEEHLHANAGGQRAYKLYIPSGYDGQPLPLVVMLHGCTQSPDDFAAGTQMNLLAEDQKLLVAYPAQSQAANAQKCWNWFNASDQRRDSGEPALIAGITRQIMRDYSVDPERVYVAGLSAGGAAAAIMGMTYPDLYAAIGVHSGLTCGAAKDIPSAFQAMRQGGATGVPGRRSASGRTVPTIVFHGDQDKTVNPLNGNQVIAQFSGMAGPLQSDLIRGNAAGGLAYTRAVQFDSESKPVFEHWVVHGAGHAWSGGSRSGSYTEPRGPDASREMLRFFMEHVRV